jgi:hypothetical protein
MSGRVPVSPMPIGNGRKAPRWARNLFFGGVIGVVVALVVLFVAGLVYGKSMCLSPVEDAGFALTMTMFLSQPAGIAGMIIGAVAGAAVGSVAHFLHHH